MDNSKEFCPHCGVSLQGKRIAKKDQGAFGATHSSRKIGIYDREADRTVAWKCPDCHKYWSRTEPIKGGCFRTSDAEIQ